MAEASDHHHDEKRRTNGRHRPMSRRANSSWHGMTASELEYAFYDEGQSAFGSHNDLEAAPAPGRVRRKISAVAPGDGNDDDGFNAAGHQYHDDHDDKNRQHSRPTDRAGLAQSCSQELSAGIKPADYLQESRSASIDQLRWSKGRGWVEVAVVVDGARCGQGIRTSDERKTGGQGKPGDQGNPAGPVGADQGVRNSGTSKQAAADGKLRSFGSRVSSTQQGWFTLYKRLFLLSFLLNLCFLLAAAVGGQLDYAKERAALFSVGNILAVVLCRSEAFLRVVFMLAVALLGCRTPWSGCVPLRLKVWVTALLQSLGGIHSGCGVSSIAWLVYALVLMRRDAAVAAPLAIQLVASGILVLLLASSLAAFPVLRHLHHNVFERVHRFAGWTSLALVWVFIFLVNSYDANKKAYVLQASALLSRQELWFTCVITLVIITPWLCLQKVPIQTLVPSSSVSIIKFPGNGIKPGLLTRISRSPLSEWHAFGTISDGQAGHMVLAGAVGDFTNKLVSKPPNHIWVRRLHFAGLPYLANMFHKVVFVATGSGICVFLSFLLQPCEADIYLIWVAKSIEKTYGAELIDLVRKCPTECLQICDTATMGGRPNVKNITVSAAQKWGAEVVIVTSNPSGTKDVVEACHAHNIPAFGPIWDS